jgi:hypothetical protein
MKPTDTHTALDTNQDLHLELRFEPESACLHSPSNPNVPALHIAFSHARMEAHFFPKGQLQATHLERAIEWVEDQIQAAHPQWPKGNSLWSNEADLHALADVAGVSQGERRVLHVDAVEQTFSRLVLQAMGQSPGQEALPSNAQFFSTIVFLRELMHHLHFPHILLVQQGSQNLR